MSCDDEDNNINLKNLKDSSLRITTECGDVKYCGHRKMHHRQILWSLIVRRRKRTTTTNTTTTKMSMKIAFLANSIWQIGNLKRFRFIRFTFTVWWEWAAEKKNLVVAVNLTDHMILAWVYICVHWAFCNLLPFATRSPHIELSTFCLPTHLRQFLVYKYEGKMHTRFARRVSFVMHKCNECEKAAWKLHTCGCTRLEPLVDIVCTEHRRYDALASQKTNKLQPHVRN